MQSQDIDFIMTVDGSETSVDSYLTDYAEICILEDDLFDEEIPYAEPLPLTKEAFYAAEKRSFLNGLALTVLVMTLLLIVYMIAMYYIGSAPN
jgi:hypothetical protein